MPHPFAPTLPGRFHSVGWDIPTDFSKQQLLTSIRVRVGSSRASSITPPAAVSRRPYSVRECPPCCKANASTSSNTKRSASAPFSSDSGQPAARLRTARQSARSRGRVGCASLSLRNVVGFFSGELPVTFTGRDSKHILPDNPAHVRGDDHADDPLVVMQHAERGIAHLPPLRGPRSEHNRGHSPWKITPLGWYLRS